METFFERLLKLRSDERLLIYADRATGMALAERMRQIAEARGCPAEILQLNSTLPLPEQAEQLAGHIRRGNYQAICELSEGYFYLTPAWQAAREKGSRIYSLQGLDEESFLRCVARVDHDLVFQFGLAVRQRLQRTRRLRITSPRGTDLRMAMGLGQGRRLVSRVRRPVLRFARKLSAKLARLLEPGPQPFAFDPCGVLDKDTTGTFLGGQVAFRGIPATIEGTAVIDGCQWPPDEIGHLKEPILIRVERGQVVGYEGCAEKSRILAQRLAGQRVQVEHFCLGFNPCARVEGRLLEAERVLAGITMGIGQRFLHTDGVMRTPSLIADDGVICENGRFTSPELTTLQAKLLQACGEVL